jgi:hypothetical protein
MADKPARLPVEKPKVRAPTNGETMAIEAAKRAHLERPARVSLTLKSDADGALTISNPHTDGVGWGAHLIDTFGTSSEAFANQSFARIANAAADRKTPLTEAQANAALALMGAVAPRDELEAAIGEQIIAAHIASLDFLARARMNAGEYRDTAVAYTNAATKLTRTMGSLVETLAKLRNGGKQQVIVKHVYVDARGSQNVIAETINRGEGSAGKNLDQPHVPGLAFAPGVPVWGEDASGDAVRAAGDARPPPVSAPRGQGNGSAQGEG